MKTASKIGLQHHLVEVFIQNSNVVRKLSVFYTVETIALN